MVANKENKAIDLVKAIMALLILALHTPLLAENNYILMPLYRLAVPFFFTVSSYFLFKKLNKCCAKEQIKVVLNYVKRNLILYFFWFIISFLFVFKERYTYMFDGKSNFILILKKLLFSSTWMGSWYIMATVLCTIIIFLLSKVLKNNLIFIISFISFLFCCFTCSYAKAFDGVGYDLFQIFCETLECTPSLSLFSGFVFISLGKILAEDNKKIYNKSRDTVLFIVFFLFLTAEFFITRKMGWQRADDSLVMLVPTIYFFVKVILQTNINIGFSKFLRAFSVIVYCSQGIFFAIFNYAFKLIGWNKTLKVDICELLLITVFCIILTSIIISLEKSKKMKFLRYIH